MARDINDLVARSLGRKQNKGCPFPYMEGDTAAYVAALEQYDYDELNKQDIHKILNEEFGVVAPIKRVYAHFNPDTSCGC